MCLSRVHPVVIRSAVFCMVYSLFVLVNYIIGNHIALPFSSVVLAMAVHVLSSFSLDFPQCVVVRAFSIFVVFFACLSCFVCVLRKCVWGQRLELIFVCFFVESVVLFIVSLSFVDCSVGCGVKSIVCVLEGFSIRLFCLVQLNMRCRYECTCCLAVLINVRVGREIRDAICICNKFYSVVWSCRNI